MDKNRKTEALAEYHVTVPFLLPKFPHGIYRVTASITCLLILYVKVRQSHHSPGLAQRVPVG